MIGKSVKPNRNAQGPLAPQAAQPAAAESVSWG